MKKDILEELQKLKKLKKNKMTQIVPAILATSQDELNNQLQKITQSESLDNGWIHIDFMDNIFVHNLSIPASASALIPNSYQKQAHLMVEKPLEWLKELISLRYRQIIVHIESKDVNDALSLIKEGGASAGIALNPETPIETLEPFKDKIDLILLMSVVPGHQGQEFIDSSIEKIKSLKALNWPVVISVDGGINEDNIRQVIEVGADQLILGSSLLEGEIEENVEKIWETIKS